MSKPPVSSPDFEVLPPDKKGGPGQEDSAARLVAYLMDNLLKVPGTQARVGINPFLDLVPVLGDGAAMVISALTIVEGLRRGVPKVILTRMGLNVLLNGLLGAVPVVGEAFSFWYKPTSRNYHLLQQHSGSTRKGTWQEWSFVIGLIAVMLVALGCFVGLGIYISFQLVHGLYALFSGAN